MSYGCKESHKQHMTALQRELSLFWNSGKRGDTGCSCCRLTLTDPCLDFFRTGIGLVEISTGVSEIFIEMSGFLQTIYSSKRWSFFSGLSEGVDGWSIIDFVLISKKTTEWRLRINCVVDSFRPAAHIKCNTNSISTTSTSLTTAVG